MNIFKNKYFLSTILLAAFIIAGIFVYTSRTTNKSSQNNSTNKSTSIKPIKKPSAGQSSTPTSIKDYKVKGVYLTGWSTGTQSTLNHFINLLNRTELNSLVIDVKDDKGQLSYKSELPLVKEVGSSVRMIADIKSTLQKLKDNKIHTIARIVVFKDPILSENKPELAIKTADGHLWRDRNHIGWLNPYNKDSWQYAIDIAKEASKLGFDEVQFDYVRFPTDGNIKNINYGESAKTTSKSEAINRFLAESKKQLSPLGIPVSADVFGIITTNKGDVEKIGQDLETICKDIDYISPMVYPSHYAYGQYEISKPDLEPYKVVYTSLATAKQRLDKLQGHKAKIRPYLQDFTAVWLHSGNYKKYTAEDIRSQIKATYDSGLDEWILWNASNKYSESAMLPEK